MKIHICWLCVEIGSELAAVKTYVEEVRQAMPAVANRDGPPARLDAFKGDRSEESKKVKNYVANTPGLRSEMGTLMVDPDYTLRHLESFQAMFTRLLDALGYTWNPTFREDPTP